MNILVTGGSGFVGTAILPKLVFDDRITGVFLLIRDSSRMTAQQRLDQLIEKVFIPEDRPLAASKISVIAGDLTLADMGIAATTKEHLIAHCQGILHIGASTDFGAPISESRSINVDGTRKILELARDIQTHGLLQRFDYVSTAFVAGTKPGVVTEADLDRRQGFANSYERSKFEAECLVQEYCREFNIPTTIYRPSIVVGDSRNGFTPHFKVLYWPLQLLSKNILPFVPCHRRAKLDIVPVDYVATAMHKIMMTPSSIGQTFYLTAGRNHGVRIDNFLQDAFKLTNIQARPLIPIWIFKLLKSTPMRKLMSDSFWQTCELAAVYNDYLAGTGVVFDNQRSLAFLSQVGAMPAPSWQSYGATILRYCMDSKWGKRPTQPEFTYRNPTAA